METCRAVNGEEDELSRFPTGERALLNVLREFRWMKISGVRESFVDASRDRAKRLNQERRRRLQRRPQKRNPLEL